MIDHFYPIAYLGGSGGSFLASWLNNAAYGYPIVLNSKNGNAHLSSIYAGFGIFSDQVSAVESLREKFTDEPHKMFIGCHIINDSLLLENFAKVTKIRYDQDDVLEIAISFCSKTLKPDGNATPHDILYEMSSTSQFRDNMFAFLPETDRSTNVSWKDLLHDDPNKLVDHLSVFYSIDATKFDVASLMSWRSLTLRNIDNARNKFGDAG